MSLRKMRVSLALAVMLAGVGLSAPRAQAGLISEGQEMQMGVESARQVEARYPLSRNARHKKLVESMGKRLAAVSSRPSLPWQFRVLESDDVNALSVPGYVYVNTGLIKFAGGDRDALAAVVAHEIAHTTRKHAVRQAEKQMVGGLVLGFILKDSGDTARSLAGVAANLALLGYSRKDELEADRHGADYLVSAGYDPKGMLRFFEKLQAREGRQSSGLATYFRTHPPTSERIRKLKEHLEKRPQTTDHRPRTTDYGP